MINKRGYIKEICKNNIFFHFFCDYLVEMIERSFDSKVTACKIETEPSKGEIILTFSTEKVNDIKATFSDFDIEVDKKYAKKFFVVGLKKEQFLKELFGEEYKKDLDNYFIAHYGQPEK